MAELRRFLYRDDGLIENFPLTSGVRRSSVLALCAVMVGLASSCASSTREVQGTESGTPPAEDPLAGINWDNPISGIPVALLAEAEPLLGFEARMPNGLGNPVGMFVTDPDSSDKADRVVAFVYDASPYGRIVVTESLLRISAKAWVVNGEEAAARNDNPEWHGTAELLTVSDRLSLLTTSEDGLHSDLRWLEGNIQFGLRGPTLDRDAVISAAAIV